MLNYLIMDLNDLIEIIKEEVEGYDFLDNDKYKKEEDNTNLIKNPEFQKEFICDSLLNKQSKIKILNVSAAELGGNWDNDPDDANILTLEYYVNIDYKYDQISEPLKFTLQFNGENIGISINSNIDKGNYETQDSGEEWFNQLNWNDILVNITTINGDDIDFIAFNKAPLKIQNLFIKEYIQDFIQDKTNMDIRTEDSSDKPQDVPYC